MTLEQFKYLSPEEQEFALNHQAVFIASMQEQEDSFKLFQIINIEPIYQLLE